MNLEPVDHDPFAPQLVPVDHDPFATPKPGQQVPPVMNPDTMSRDAARTVVDMARPFWMDMEPTDREIVERSNAMQTGQTGPGKVLPTTGMNPVPFAALDIGSMLPVGGIAKLAGAALGAGAKGALKVAAEEAAPRVAQGIRAYHGSPHDFERFDLSKIGTGEGAQAYGHGLYFAEAEPVAREYRSKLGGKPDVVVGGQTIAPRASIFEPAEADQIVASRLSALADLHAAINKEQITTPEAVSRVAQDIDNSLASATRNNDFELFQKLQDQKTALARMQEQGIDLAHKGRMYEVNINANPEHFLDWDKPLSEQSEQARNAIKQALVGDRGNDLGQRAFESLQNANAADIHREIHYRPDMASSKLKDAGIPGIKYLDQGSRQPKTLFNGQPIPANNPPAQLAAEKLDLHGSPDRAIASLESDAAQGHPYIRQSSADAAALLKSGTVARSAPQGTSNYVLFDDKLIDIVKKYGIAGLGAFPVGSRFLHPVDHDPFVQ